MTTIRNNWTKDAAGKPVNWLDAAFTRGSETVLVLPEERFVSTMEFSKRVIELGLLKKRKARMGS